MTGLVPSEQQAIIVFSSFIQPFIIDPPGRCRYIWRSRPKPRSKMAYPDLRLFSLDPPLLKPMYSTHIAKNCLCRLLGRRQRHRLCCKQDIFLSKDFDNIFVEDLHRATYPIQLLSLDVSYLYLLIDSCRDLGFQA